MSDDESVSDELWNEIESRLEDQSITFHHPLEFSRILMYEWGIGPKVGNLLIASEPEWVVGRHNDFLKAPRNLTQT